MSIVSKNIVVIDDEKYVCNIIMEALSEFSEYHVTNFTDPQKALDFIASNSIDLVLTDLVMGDYSGVQILEAAQKHHKDAVVILMTGYPTVKTAISVLQKGGYDYLIKPFKLEDLQSTIARGLEHQQIKRDNVQLRSQLELISISDAVASGVKFPTLLSMITDTAVNELSADGASIILLDRKANKYRCRYVSGEHLEADVKEFLSGEGVYGIDSFDLSAPFNKCGEIGTRDNNYCRNFIAYPLLNKGQNIGFLNLVSTNKFSGISSGQENLISMLASTAASAAEANHMDKLIRRSYLLTIKALANAVEARDIYTAGHTDRVYRVAKIIARRLDWGSQEIQDLRTGSILHDIGKIGVPDAILNKPGKLTDEEFAIMRKHPETGMKILSGIPFLKPVLPYVIAHHEKYDGSGYPYGLKGKDIPIEGRLLAVIDTFDAILSDRPYRESADPEWAIKELLLYKGIQFDPDIVDIFVEAYYDGEIKYGSIYANRTGKIPVTTIRSQKAPV